VLLSEFEVDDVANLQTFDFSSELAQVAWEGGAGAEPALSRPTELATFGAVMTTGLVDPVLSPAAMPDAMDHWITELACGGDPQRHIEPLSMAGSSSSRDNEAVAGLGEETLATRDTALTTAVSTLDSLSTPQRQLIFEMLRQQFERIGIQDHGAGAPRRGQPREPQSNNLNRVMQTLAQSMPLPDPQRNVLRTLRGNSYRGYAANAASLGIDHPEDLFLEDILSPFSVTVDRGHRPEELDIVRPYFSRVPADLQPTDAQLTTSHHPYLVS
jgi:hypothetical protein